jgi:cbb3-type cytochrome oxidase subunit 1
LLSHRLILTAIAFFVAGVLLGMYAGITQDFRFTHVHAHVNLLGWVALGLIGLLYAVHPHLQRGRLATAHYWMHTLGLVLFMGGFAWKRVDGQASTVPLAIGASTVAVAVLLLAVHVFTRLRASAE